jgi:hypothetical protein
MGRTVHHPIAVFIVAVLAVIGIGVGVLAASGGAGFVMAPNLTEGPSRTYGPPGLQFLAAFPGTPTCRMEQNGSAFGCQVGHTAHEFFGISVTNTARLPKGAYHPHVLLCLAKVICNIRREGAHGQELALLCSDGNTNPGGGAYLCAELLTLERGPLVWSLVGSESASYLPPTGVLTAFLRSLEPRG